VDQVPPDAPDATLASRPAKPAKIDGRHLRSERTRRLIVEAYMTLVRESPQVPTAAQIAERAGYSVRSIFERFPDLHALRLAATDYAIAEGTALNPMPSMDTDRKTRIRTQIEARAMGCDRWLPLWRVLNANTNESPELQKRISLVRQLILRRIELVFQPELTILSGSDRRRTVLALEAIIDFESWARMRELYGLSHDEACKVWIGAFDRLLPPTPGE
jgi:AcrR family transcriptional regulator